MDKPRSAGSHVLAAAAHWRKAFDQALAGGKDRDQATNEANGDPAVLAQLARHRSARQP